MSDIELGTLIDRQREWERDRDRAAASSDAKALLRGARNALLIAVPVWVGVWWWIGH